MKTMMHNPMAQAPTPSAPTARHAVKSGRESLDVARSLREHRLLAIGVGIVVLAGMLSVGFLRPAIYSTESLVYIQPSVPKVLSDGSEPPYDPSKYDSYFQQQMKTVTRYDILQAALSQLGSSVWQTPGESQQSAIARLQSALKVTRIDNSYQMSISLKGTNSEAIAEVVNTVTDAYLAKSRKDELAQVNQRLEALTQERERIQAALTADRDEQTALDKALGVANTTADPYDAQIAAVRDELVKAREARDVAEVQLSSVRSDTKSSQALNAMADEMIANDPGLSSMKTAINQRLSLLNSQMSGLTPNHPLYKLDQQEIAKLNQSLDSMTAQLRTKAAQHLQEKLSVDLARSNGVEARLNEQLAQQMSAAAKGGPKLQRAAELAADIARQEVRFASVDDMVRSLQLESSASGQAHISMPAMRPFAPDPSRKMLLIWGALPMAVLLGLASAITARKLDPRVYIAEDIQEVLQFPPMAVIPHREDVSSATVDEYMLRLAAAVGHALRLDGAQTFVFTSVSASTMVEDVVGNLAREMQGLGHRATVMSAAGAIQRHAAGGLPQGALRNETSLAHFNGGPKGEDAHSDAVIENVQRLHQENELLLISAQPLMTSGESEYLARYADATILVAESGVTTRKELAEAGALLERLNAAGAGVVLTNLSMRYADTSFKKSIWAFEQRPRLGTARLQPQMQSEQYAGPERRRALGSDAGGAELAREDGQERRRRDSDRAGLAAQPLRDRRNAPASSLDGRTAGEDCNRRNDSDAAAENGSGQVDISIDIYNGPDRRVHLPYHVYVGVERRSSNLRQARDTEQESQPPPTDAARSARNITPPPVPAALPSQPVAVASALHEMSKLEAGMSVACPTGEKPSPSSSEKAGISAQSFSISAPFAAAEPNAPAAPIAQETPRAATPERKSSEYSAFITETFDTLTEALAAEIASTEAAYAADSRQFADFGVRDSSVLSTSREYSGKSPEILSPSKVKKSGWLRLIDRDSRMMRAFTGEQDDEDIPTLPSKPGQYSRRRM
ncbi:MAG: GumC family protein [Acidobacteriaceae bacterium]